MAKSSQDLAMTAREFLDFEGEPDARYELVDGRPQMMDPPANAHGTITGNAWGEVDRRLEARPPCRAQVEAGIWISDAQFYQAHLAATCAPADRERFHEPFLLVEVLSSSTKPHDRGRKLEDYKAIASVNGIWLIDSERRAVEVWWRDALGWTARDFVGGPAFDSVALGDRITLDRLYRGTEL